MAISNLATENSHAFLPLLKSMQKMEELLTSKLNQLIKKDALNITKMIEKAIRIVEFHKQKGLTNEP